MKIDLTNNISNNSKENKEIKNFMKELTDILKRKREKKNDSNDRTPIIEKILNENNVTTGNENAIRMNEDKIIIEYIEKVGISETVYFVKDSKKTYWKNNKRYYDYDVYTVLKVQDKKIETIEISKKNMPKTISTNDVFRIKDNKYILDNIVTKELQDELINMANKIISKQKSALNNYRKEGHLYKVTDRIKNNIFLVDMTNKSKIEFEETEFPKSLLEKAIRRSGVSVYKWEI